MIRFNPFQFAPYQTAVGLVALLSAALPLGALSQPAQKPLLSSATGAKPNLMIALDNSGSMAFPFHETYGITSGTTSADDVELKTCPSPYSSIDSTDSTTFSAGIGGQANYSSGTYTCYERYLNKKGNWKIQSRTDVALSYAPAQWSSAKWAAQRSSEVNPIYYDPRVTYSARVDASGDPLVPKDGIVFVSNQDSGEFNAEAYVKDSDTSIVRLDTKFYASNPSTDYWTRYSYTSSAGGSFVPRHVPYTTTDTTTPAFTYTYCDSVVTTSGKQVDCAQPRKVDIKPGTPATIALPTGHSRTDKGCASNVCTNEAEITNILNWYRYYGFRAPAVVTAIGQALANSDYNKELRVGYININQRDKDSSKSPPATTKTPGIDTNDVGFIRGVRKHELGTSDTQALYTWLYDQDGSKNRTSNSRADATFGTDGVRYFLPAGSTPLHNVLDKIATYYKVGTDAVENPWATNPAALASASNPELSCRRSFTLLFSDGSWNAGTTTISGEDFDNTAGNATTGTFTRTLTNGTTDSFTYKPAGINTEAGRKLYTTYPSTATSGLADLTAKYFWHTDLRSALTNGILTRTGQPAFWQNMTTYTVGYQIKPSGNTNGNTTGLTFEKIATYQAEYAAKGYASATKPKWVTGDVNTTSKSDQDRVDDFIQAGYTGGGRGFSATSAADVRSIFNIILSDILNSSGKDAGVAVSASSSSTDTIAGLLKYSVSYKTLDNSGDITAQELDKDGNVLTDTDKLPITKWSASDKLPDPDKRNVFTISGDNTGTEFKGKLSALPTDDLKAALKYGDTTARVPDDERFINYLRGLDPVVDNDGKLFRQRGSKLGAMVNPPSVYMGGARDFAYDLVGSVDGRTTYLDYVNRKKTWPVSLLVATNAGMVHNLNSTTGEELAAFMPRRSLKRMLNYARDDYTFEYTLDGPLSEHDIYDGTTKTWNHLAVGTGGRGERLIYALRSPLNGEALADADRIPGKTDFLWEVGPTTGPETVGSTAETDTINTSDFALGYMTQAARSGQTDSGDWVVVLNSGHYNGSTDGSKHGLLVLNALTGATLKRIPLPATYSAGRGLSGVTMVRDAKQKIVAAYAGDANGNLWRFNLKGDKAKWGVSYDKPLYTTANNRPIYGAPAWQAHPKGGTIVVVATGMLLDEDDVKDTTEKEAIYGIWDPTTIGESDTSTFTTVSTSELLVQGLDTDTPSVVKGSNTYSRTTKAKIDWTKHRGWTFALGHTYDGERNIDQIRNVSTSVFINTTVIKAPADTDAETCSAAGLPVNYRYGLRALDGASQYSFDVDKDGTMDNVSMVLVADGGFSRGYASVTVEDSQTDPTSQRKSNHYDTDAGESSPTPEKCKTIFKEDAGLLDGTQRSGSYCPITGWSRSQYQLSSPPAN